nr:hypothetical protein CFP56_71697 [Quercus suber]
MSEPSPLLACRPRRSSMSKMPPLPPLLALPDELLQHVLGYLGPVQLAGVAQVCRRLLQQSYDDLIWQPLVNENLHDPIFAPTPLKSFRELFIAHHPHWFLPRHRIWFADNEHMGKLLLARYRPSTGSIEAHAVTATLSRRPSDLEPWEKDPSVMVIRFAPQMSLDLHQPVLKLEVDSPVRAQEESQHPDQQAHTPVFAKELMMRTFEEAGLYASFMFCRTLPDEAITDNTNVWPPLRLPALARTRNLTGSSYNATGHRPTGLADLSQHNFRLRKWLEYHHRRAPGSNGSSAWQGMPPFVTRFTGPYFAAGLSAASMDGMSLRIPETITTYATLPESCYTPTRGKPWQGIWCGDYSGHGCEFIVIRQPDKHEAQPLPSGMAWLSQWFRGPRSDSTSSDSSFVSAPEEAEEQTREPLQSTSPRDTAIVDDDSDDDAPTGRLEAIKLTGDPHIPRGEYTFIAPDIGPGGFMRIADEAQFRGARVVRSAGHIAGPGFAEGMSLFLYIFFLSFCPLRLSKTDHPLPPLFWQNKDSYTPSQLILLSHDRIAQFWEGFGHISYFERVDLDALMRA